MRLVLNTNVVVSALLWGGVPYKLLQAAVAGEAELYTSAVLLDELRGILVRPHLAKRLIGQRRSVEQAVESYARLCHSVQPLHTPRVVLHDPDDDHVVAAAIEAQAHLIKLAGLGPTDNRESALAATLAPGPYTARAPRQRGGAFR